MCLAGQVPAAPSTAAEAVAMAQAGLGWLAKTDVASLTTAEQADCLRGLARAESMHTAARSRVLGAFHAQCGYEDDGHGSAKPLGQPYRNQHGTAAGHLDRVLVSRAVDRQHHAAAPLLSAPQQALDDLLFLLPPAHNLVAARPGCRRSVPALCRRRVTDDGRHVNRLAPHRW